MVRAMPNELAELGLNESQKILVTAISRGSTIADAERAAGYANGVGSNLMSRPHMRLALEHAIRREIQDCAPIALRTLRDLVKTGSERIRVDAAKILLDRAGYVPPSKSADVDAGEKQLTEMTQDELHAAMEKSAAQVERMEAELAARAITVSVPNAGDMAEKPNSFLD